MTIYEALLAVQKEIEPISKSETNPFFKSKYFDINALLGELKPVLNKHGIVLTQGLGQSANFEGNAIPALITKIRIDREVEEYILPLPKIDDPQKFGSMVSYYRRYAIQSLFALEAEDDDSNIASGKVAQPIHNQNNTYYVKVPVQPATKPIAIQNDKPDVFPKELQKVKPPVTQNDEDVAF